MKTYPLLYNPSHAPPDTVAAPRFPNRHSRNGSTFCASTFCRHSGHSAFSFTQSCTHVQQKTCPHVVTDGSLNGSRHSVHFRWPVPGGIHAKDCADARLCRGASRMGVAVMLEREG